MRKGISAYFRPISAESYRGVGSKMKKGYTKICIAMFASWRNPGRRDGVRSLEKGNSMEKSRLLVPGISDGSKAVLLRDHIVKFTRIENQ